MYINVDLISHHEPVEGNPLHTKITFDAFVNGEPLVLELDIPEVELIHLIENAKDYDYEPGFH
jgi:hypothetical protein